MKRLGFLFIPFILISCQTMITSTVGYTQPDPSYKVINKTFLGANALVIFRGYDYLKSAEDKKAQDELRIADYSKIPEYGAISILTRGWSIETGNPKQWLFIIHDADNNEIFRGYGDDKIPDYEVSATNYAVTTSWEHETHIRLNADPKFPLYVRVVGPAPSEPQDFEIIKNQ